jgi:chromatin remodeling complex protein RSC6
MAVAKKKKTTTKRKAGGAFMKPLTPSDELSLIVGAKALPRTEVVKKLWQYIKKHGLQDKKNRRMINSDDKLKPVFSGKKQVSMFEMTKLVSKHLS